MGKLVHTSQTRYYGNVRRRAGEQFVMADKEFVAKRPVLDHEGKPVIEKGKPLHEEVEVTPMGITVLEDGHEDPVFESEADLKKKMKQKPVKRGAVKHQPDDLRQGGAFDVHPEETGIQVTGQVAPARPVSASGQVVPDVVDAKDDGKKKGKSVI